MKFPLPGLVAAPFTPFRADGELALDVVPRQARALAANGVIGAFVGGTTGEGSSMTNDERCRVTEAWIAARPAGLKIIAHVGHLSAGDSRALARHAQDAGADAIAAVAPSFFKPAGVAELVAWCAHVAAAAPKLPFFYYHIPSMTNVTIPAAAFLAEARAKIPTLAGIKFTHDNLGDFSDTHAIGGSDYQVLFGRDELLLPALTAGATGAVGSTYNYAAPIYLGIMRAFSAGDRATAERGQARACAMIDTMVRFGGQPAGKAIMKLIGIDCGPVRLPMRGVPAAREPELRAALEAQGFFEFASKGVA